MATRPVYCKLTELSAPPKRQGGPIFPFHNSKKLDGRIKQGFKRSNIIGGKPDTINAG